MLLAGCNLLPSTSIFVVVAKVCQIVVLAVRFALGFARFDLEGNWGIVIVSTHTQDGTVEAVTQIITQSAAAPRALSSPRCSRPGTP